MIQKYNVISRNDTKRFTENSLRIHVMIQHLWLRNDTKRFTENSLRIPVMIQE